MIDLSIADMKELMHIYKAISSWIRQMSSTRGFQKKWKETLPYKYNTVQYDMALLYGTIKQDISPGNG